MRDQWFWIAVGSWAAVMAVVVVFLKVSSLSDEKTRRARVDKAQTAYWEDLYNEEDISPADWGKML